MPLKLRDPRPPKTPNYSVRGTYLGIYVERTAGTPDKKVATGVLKGIKRAIERGDYDPAPEPVEAPRPPTFADAALAYLKAGGEPNYIGKIIELTGPHALRDKPLAEIDQIAIDNAAAALYPGHHHQPPVLHAGFRRAEACRHRAQDQAAEGLARQQGNVLARAGSRVRCGRRSLWYRSGVRAVLQHAALHRHA